LARRDADYLIVVQAISFAEIQNAVTLPRPAALQLNLRNGKHLALHATRAAAIQSMITGFVLEYRKVSSKHVTHIISMVPRANSKYFPRITKTAKLGLKCNETKIRIGDLYICFLFLVNHI